MHEHRQQPLEWHAQHHHQSEQQQQDALALDSTVDFRCWLGWSGWLIFGGFH
jgi:hypothetical protein